MPTGDVQRALSSGGEQVGRALAQLVEDQWFERKSGRISARDLGRVIVAMANADGGVIVVGVHGGAVEGTDRDARGRNDLMQANADFCQPPARVDVRLIDCRNEDGDANHLLVLEVSPSDDVHSTVRDEVLLRVGDETRTLSFAQRQELLYDKGQASYEARPLKGAGVEMVVEDLLTGYAAALQAPDPVRLLEARGLALGAKLTVAGCLLFGSDPQRFLPEAFVRVLRYRGRERGTGSRQQLVDDIRFDGPIPRVLVEARQMIHELQPRRRALTTASGRFEQVGLIPEDAWLEGLVNAVVHRSYSAAGDHIRVDIFDDRIEVSSPGRFPGVVDLHDPQRAIRFARNPRIARVCSDLNFGQELGEGIRRMFDEMRTAGLTDPIYRQTSGSVVLSLLTEPVDRELEARLPERARVITATLRQAERLSTGDIAAALSVSRPVALRQLGLLRDAGVIEWVGQSPKDPRAYWRLATT